MLRQHYTTALLHRRRLRSSLCHASFTTQPDSFSAAVAVASSAPVNSRTMRTARSRSFTLLGFRSTIRLLITLPVRTMARVVKIFRISFVAVPDLSRVEPVRISGPTSGARMRSGRCRRGFFRVGFEDSNTVVVLHRPDYHEAPPWNEGRNDGTV